jgi:hypothetical protein
LNQLLLPVFVPSLFLSAAPDSVMSSVGLRPFSVGRYWSDLHLNADFDSIAQAKLDSGLRAGLNPATVASSV